MTTPIVSDFLKYANLQMAAEAFIRDEKTEALATSSQDLEDALIAGNIHASRFTASQAKEFAAHWVVVDQKANTPSGFSGTLFRCTEDDASSGAKVGDLVLSFRSTEFIDDAIRDNFATNTLEIKDTGFAWGQLADMEKWYAELRADPAKLQGQSFSVTGYSLGGHLATAFNMLHRQDVKEIVTFNGAGVGLVETGNLQSALDSFELLRNNPDQIRSLLFPDPYFAALYDRLRQQLDFAGKSTEEAKALTEAAITEVQNFLVLAEEASSVLAAGKALLSKALDDIRDMLVEALRIRFFTAGGEGPGANSSPREVSPAEIVAENLDYRLAVAVASQYTEAAWLIGGLIRALGSRTLAEVYGNQFDVVAIESTTSSWSAVANSQWHHGEEVPIFIEDQPFARGDALSRAIKDSVFYLEPKLLVDHYGENDFGDNHSLVLLVDSLTVQNVLLRLLPEGQRAGAAPALTLLLRAASAIYATMDSDQGRAEGDALENVVNALGGLLLGPGSNIGRLVGNTRGNTWWETENVGAYTGREQFHRTIAELTAEGSPFHGFTGRMTIELSDTELATEARDEFAALLPLLTLSPMALKAAPGCEAAVEAAFAARWATEYAHWVADKALTREQRAEGQLHYTDQYLQDRAAFLANIVAANLANTCDGNVLLVEALGSDLYYLSDKTTGISVRRINAVTGEIDGPCYIFGGEGDDSDLSGDSEADHLYGGGGDDTLVGKRGDDYQEGGVGNDQLLGEEGLDRLIGGEGDDTLDGGEDDDYLEGGEGDDTLRGGQGKDNLIAGNGDDTLTGGQDNDTLKGGEGDDEYVFSDGDGWDVIDDPDPVGGSIRIGNDLLVGGEEASAGLGYWLSTDPEHKYRYVLGAEGDGSHTLTIFSGTERIFVKDFVDGKLGIILGVGSLHEAEPNEAVWLLDYSRLDRGLPPELHGSFASWAIFGGSFPDTISGSRGDDQIEGGIDAAPYSDSLYGLEGNDRLYADMVIDIAQAIETAKQARPFELVGDLLDGDAGNDLLVGRPASNLLFGGGGSDTIIGGGDADVVEGDGMSNYLYPEGDTFVLAHHPVKHGFIYYIQAAEKRWNGDYTELTDRFYRFGRPALDGNADTVVTGAGRDVVFGETGDDYLSVGSGDDFATGGGDSDTIDGGADNDFVTGDFNWDAGPGPAGETPLQRLIRVGLEGQYHGQDVLDGGEGDDWVEGNGRDDVLRGGGGNDTLYGDDEMTPESYHGDDFLDGGEGDDSLEGNGAGDTLVGAEGDDQLFGDDIYTPGTGHGEDVLYGDDGNDSLWGNGDDDSLFGGAGKDYLVGDDDSLDSAYHGDDFLDGGEGADGLTGGGGDDTLRGGQGTDWLDGSDGDDRLYGGGDRDDLRGEAGDDFLDGEEGADGLRGGAGKDVLRGGAGSDSLEGGAGNDNLQGGSGDDGLWGGADNDTLTGGFGADYLVGEAGDDTYVFHAGDGPLDAADMDFEYIEDDSGYDTVDLRGVSPYSLRVVALNEAQDLLLTYGADDQLLIKSWALGTIESFVIAGETLDCAQLVGRYAVSPLSVTIVDDHSVHFGGAGDDEIIAPSGFSIVSGGRGNDTLIVDGDNNIIVYATGDGVDRVTTGGSGNVLRLAGDISVRSLRLSLGSLALRVGSNPDDIIHFETFDAADALSHKPFERIEFADGTTIGYETLLALGFDLTGSAAHDAITGSSVADRIVGGAGNDSLYGGGGDDRLDGGAGNDSLVGGDGRNTYVWESGGGQDVIDNGAAAPGKVDTLHIDGRLLAADVVFLRQDNDLIVGLRNSADRVRVINHFAGSPLAAVSFAADGLLWDAADIDAHLTKQLSEAADDYSGSDGNDIIAGLGGNDKLYGLSGDDVIDGGSGEDSLFGNDGADTLFGGGGNDALFGSDGQDVLVGGDGADVLYGDAGADLLDGRADAEADEMRGGSDGDIYLFARGSGADVIVEAGDALATDILRLGSGITPADVLAKRQGSDLLLQVFAGNDRMSIVNHFSAAAGTTSKIERIEFDNLAVWSELDIRRQVLLNASTSAGDTIEGFDGNDTIRGLAGDDYIRGADGNDYLLGDDGRDMIIGGNGSDVLNGGGGIDYLYGELGSDVYVIDALSSHDQIREIGSNPGDIDSIAMDAGIKRENVVLSRSRTGEEYDHLRIVIGDGIHTLQEITVENFFLRQDEYYKVEQVVFSDGFILDLTTISDLLDTGTESSDLIMGDRWDSVMNGRGGGDILNGHRGNDIIHGGAGDDAVYGEVGRDTLAGGSGKDSLYGGIDDDTYRYGRGDGLDVVDESFQGGGNDTLELIGDIKAGDVALYRHAEDLIVVVDQNAVSQIRLGGFFSSANYRIEFFRFSDQAVWDSAMIAAHVIAGTPNAMRGSSADDVFLVDDTLDSIIEEANQGVDTVISNVNWTLGANIENLTLTGVLNIEGIGNSLRNVIRGNEANNDLYADQSGYQVVSDGVSDTLLGGKGDDTYWLQGGEEDKVVENANEGNDTVVTKFSYVLPENVENLRVRPNFSSASGIDLIGNALDNVIDGSSNQSALIIDGGAGADRMIGNGGSDTTYRVDNAADVVVEAQHPLGASDGDLIETVIDYALGADSGVEILQLKNGSAALSGSGNAFNNTLKGNTRNNLLQGLDGNDTLDGGAGGDTLLGGSGDDIFYGGSGADRMVGGEGNDAYYLDPTRVGTFAETGRGALPPMENDEVIEAAGEGWDTVYSIYDYVLTANVESLVLESYRSALFYGADYDMHALRGTGNGLNNDLTGNAGNNILDGRSGADRMFGLAGNDTYHVDNIADVVIEDRVASGGVDTVIATVSYVLVDGVENLVLTGTADDSGTGNGLDNRLDGSPSAGANQLIGGAGDDTYVLAHGDAAVEQVGEGDDTVIASASISLAANVENLFLNGDGDIDGTGNRQANTLHGTSGINRLDGAAGADTMRGAGGADTYVVDCTGDSVIETDHGGGDTVESWVDWTLAPYLENLVLVGTAAVNGTGNELDNVITGNAANNVLDGGLGNDTYRFGNGSGQDTIRESVDSTDGKRNVLRMLPGIRPVDVGLTRAGNDLAVSLLGTTDKMTIRDFCVNNNLWSPSNPIQRIEFDGGIAWDLDDIQKILFPEHATLGEVTIAGTATQNEVLTARNTLEDENGLGDIFYQWQSSTDGTNWSAITGATASTLALTEAQVGRQLRVVANYTDGLGSVSFKSSAAIAAVGNVNDAPSGSVSIVGVFDLNQVLSANVSLSDADGLGTIAYQWQRSSDGSNWVAIAGATANTLALTETLLSGQVRVIAAYIDGHGTLESVASPARASNHAPVFLGGGGVAGAISVDVGSVKNIGYGVDIQPDGKYVLTGTSGDVAVPTDFTLVRFNVDGSLDRDFGGDGKVTTPVGPSIDASYALAVQDDGRILVGGYISQAATMCDFTVVRYAADGSLDVAFGDNGKVVTDIGGYWDQAYAMAVQADGKVVLGGYTSGNSSERSDFALLRYNGDGSPDTSFAGDGKASTSAGYFTEHLRSVAIQSDGKVLAAGFGSGDGYVNPDLVVQRYDSSGALDDSFDGDGIVTVNSGGYDMAEAVAVQPDGKILVSGLYGAVPTLMRFNGNGAIDTGFGAHGRVSTTINFDGLGHNLAVQTDGKILLAGWREGAHTDRDFALARYNGDGSVDSDFGVGGVVTTVVSNGSDIAVAVKVLADGRIVAVGSKGTSGSDSDFVLARYNANGVLDTSFGSGGRIADLSVDKGSSFRYTVPTALFVDTDAGDLLRYSATKADGSSLPAWLSFDPTTRTFSGTPSSTDVGVSGLKVTVTDEAGAMASSNVFNLTVVFVNSGPTGTVTIDGTPAQNQVLIAGNSLADVDGLGTIGYQWQSSLDGLTWSAIAGATGASLMLTQGQVGKQLRVVAAYTDRFGIAETMASAPTAVVANVNDAPVVANLVTDMTATERIAFSATLPTNVFRDIDVGDGLTYSAKLADGSPLPAWLSVNSLTGTFQGTPLAAGTIGVRLTATDVGGLSASDVFDIVIASVNKTLNGTANADILAGDIGNDLLNGLAGNDTLNGMEGNDTLDGGAGSDSLVGGFGDDIYTVDNVADRTVENAGAGSDLVQSSIAWTLAANVENLTLTGMGIVSGIGNELDNRLTGNMANNILDGGEGIDTLIGGAGDDTYVVDNIDDVVVENVGEGVDQVQSRVSCVLAANVENLVLTGGNAIDGVGNALNNILTGNAASNVLNGGSGADVLLGGGGNDTYYVGAGDKVSEAVDGGVDNVIADVSWQLGGNLENLTLAAAAAVNGAGNALNNVLAGNGSSNVLDGGGGADTMSGGLGDDTYLVDHIGDVVTEYDDEGRDVVQSSVTCALSANVENLTLVGADAVSGMGNALQNTLVGNAADNILDGGAAADVLSGGGGNDTYYVGAGDTITEAAGAGTDTVVSDVAWTLGNNLENLVLSSALAIAGTGNSLNNVLTGNEAGNFLDGGSGADTLAGGLGDDLYVVDNIADKVVENSAAGTDLIQSSVSYNLSPEVENLTLTGIGGINGGGNAWDNVLIGNAAANVLDGAAGSDTLVGGAGNDTYVIDSIGDVLVENAGEGSDLVKASLTCTLGENFENLILSGITAINGGGNALNNQITGNAADNILDGGAGIDTLAGGAGNDTYYVGAGDTVLEISGAGRDTVIADVAWTLGSELENLTLVGAAAISGTGNTLKNLLIGNSAANTLSGAGGADTLQGGSGDDIYVVDNVLDAVVEQAGEGSDLIQSSVSYVLSTEVENLTLTGTASINGSGNALDNVLMGNGAANVLDGAAGSDTLIGGAGNDTYVIDSIGDVLVEYGGGGSDLVQSSLTCVLSGSIENLVLSGTAAINGIGNALNNQITGNVADNILDGGAGIDTLAGGAGNDTYYVGVGDTVTEIAGGGGDTVIADVSWTLGAELEKLILAGTGAINGTGNALDNLLIGNGAANTLSGGMGADTLQGGAGDDAYVVDNALDIVTEKAGEGSELIQSSVTYLLSEACEHLTLTGSDAIDGTGNALNNMLTGNAAANVLDGASGVDTLVGGGGNDTYVVDGVTDTVTEAAGAGNDLVRSSVGWLLGANLENLTLTGANAIDGRGNALANMLVGNAAANVLSGAAGADTLVGGAGADTLFGGLGDDTYLVDAADSLTENAGEGIDTVQSTASGGLGANVENLILTGSAIIDGTGNALNNVLTGNGAANVLIGGAGNDTLNGAAGADILRGGVGDDSYVVDNMADSVGESAGEGIDLVQSAVSHVLSANVENLTLTGSVAIDGAGNDLNNVVNGNNAANVLTGGAGNDTLNGAAGADSLRGGVGDDTYVVDHVADAIGENSGEGLDLVQSAVSHVLSANVENLTLTGSATIDGTGNELGNVLTGNGVANVLNGGGGNDVLSGAGGADTLVGGLGDDTYVVDNARDVVTEKAGEGGDLIQSSVTYLLSDACEYLTLTGGSTIDGTGNALNNLLSGNAAANVLDGASGVDTLIGGGGNDTYIVDSATDTITEAAGAGNDLVRSSVGWTLGTNLENLTLTGTNAIDGRGNALANVLVGNAAANVLSGAAGADTLDGGVGVDTLVGGLGDDTYRVDTVDTVTENGGEGLDLVQSAVSHVLSANVENLTLIGGVAIDGSGNELNNVVIGNGAANILTGGAGNDTLNGAAGVDSLRGGVGDDTYVVDDVADAIGESAGEGLDLVQSAVSHVLSANVENLTLTGSATIDGTGNELGNVLTGNGAANVLSGGGGNDTLNGGLGADTLIGGIGDDIHVVDNKLDIVTENSDEGTDLLQSSVSVALAANVEALVLTGTANINGSGNASHNLLRGNIASNTLDGGSGNDILDGDAGNDSLSDTSGAALFSGGTGADTLSGGAAAEIFIGGTGSDSYSTGAGNDVVLFNKGDGQDIFAAGGSGRDTLSLGGRGLAYTDLNFIKSSDDLVLKIGASDQLTFKNWYATNSSRPVANLQVIAEAMAGFSSSGADPLRDQKVENFDFTGLVGAFDTARTSTPTLTAWALSNALVSFRLGGSDSAAMAGDLAYQYGRNGSLAGIGFTAAQDLIGNASLGTQMQALQTLASLQTGSAMRLG